MKLLSRPYEVFLFSLKTLIVLLLLSFSGPIKSANPQDVVVNEVAWMGTKVEAVESKNWWRYEWLELYNNSSSPISLNNWEIQLHREKLDWASKLSGTIQPNSYFLIVSSDKIFTNYDLNYSNLTGKFNNGGQKITLKDSEGSTIDSVDCFSSGKWFAGDNLTKQTMERISPLSDGSDSVNWGSSYNQGGTPRIKNSTNALGIEPSPTLSPTPIPPPDITPASTPNTTPDQVAETSGKKPSPYPSGIFINELMPSPIGADGKEEWIELYNSNNFETDISDWQITDTIGAAISYHVAKGTKIPAQGFLLLSRPETKIVLNNDGDGLKLTSPDGIIADSVTYEKAPRGQSYAKGLDNKWHWSDNPTPGTINAMAKEQVLPAQKEDKAAIAENPESAGAEKNLASINQEVSRSDVNLKKYFIAFTAAIISGILILIAKSKLNKNRLT